MTLSQCHSVSKYIELVCDLVNQFRCEQVTLWSRPTESMFVFFVCESLALADGFSSVAAF